MDVYTLNMSVIDIFFGLDNFFRLAQHDELHL